MDDNNFFLICDESGAKSYADCKEEYRGQLGVVSGFLTQQGAHAESVKNKLLERLPNKFSTSDKKLHITDDLDEESQQILRKNIYKVFQEKYLRLFYGAIYVTSFNRFYGEMKEQHISSCNAARDNNLGVSKNSKMPLMHGHLFYQMYSKAYCHLLSVGIINPKITVITDKIDTSIKKEYLSQIKEFHTTFCTKTEEWSRFDFETNKVEKLEASISLKPNGEQLINPNFCSEILEDNSLLTTAADVLTNSVYYELNLYAKKSNYGWLNSTEAIQNHLLSKQFMCLRPNKFGPSIMDRKFGYNKGLTSSLT